MYLKEETLFRSTQWPIIDADCKKDLVIVLLKGKGENRVQLNGKTIFTGPTGHWKIRFTKDHFCLLNHTTLSFYTLTGDFVFDCEVGDHIFELFPFQQGVLCIYSDEGVYGKKLGKNRLNYVAPFQQPESYYDTAIQNQLLFDALFARYKPYACLGFSMESNELFFLDAQLKRERTMEVPFYTGNVISFALTYEFGVFLEENRLLLWEFETTGQVSEYPGEFGSNTRAIFSRHEYLFMTVLKHEVQVFKPIMNHY